MLSQEIVHQDFRSVGDTVATPANGRQELALLLAMQEEQVRATLARVQEYADIEVEDVFAQADEALILG
jgi:hypothetical protein